MTDTPADPIAAEARDLYVALDRLCENPWCLEKGDEHGCKCDCARDIEVIAAALHRMKSAGRAEASAWRPIESDAEALAFASYLPLPKLGQHVGRAVTLPNGDWLVFCFDQDNVRFNKFIRIPSPHLPLPPRPEGGER